MGWSMTGIRTPTAGLCAGPWRPGGRAEEWLVFGNGAADLIVRLAMAVKPRQALVPAPTFSEYEAAVKLAGGETRRFFLDGSRGYRVTADYAGAVRPGDEMVFLCNPNKPTRSLAGARDGGRYAGGL